MMGTRNEAYPFIATLTGKNTSVFYFLPKRLPYRCLKAIIICLFRYRKNKNFGGLVREPEPHPLSALARNANIFIS